MSVGASVCHEITYAECRTTDLSHLKALGRPEGSLPPDVSFSPKYERGSIPLITPAGRCRIISCVVTWYFGCRGTRPRTQRNHLEKRNEAKVRLNNGSPCCPSFLVFLLIYILFRAKDEWDPRLSFSLFAQRAGISIASSTSDADVKS